MADRVYVQIEDYTLTTLEADATLAAEVTTFDPDGKEPEDYDEHLTPAVQVECMGSDVGGEEGEEPITISGRQEVHYRVAVYVMHIAGDQKTRLRAVKNIVARIETVMRNQLGSNQMSGLDQVVANADAGSVVTNVLSSQFVDAELADHRLMAISQTLLDLAIDIDLEE